MRIVPVHLAPTACVLALAMACAAAFTGCDHAPDAPPVDAYGVCDASADGIGRTYFGREIALYMSHQGIYWLERGTRAAEERTDLLLDALALQPAMTVADIGAGSGYFTLPIAHRVTQGRVYATDIQGEMLEFLEARARTEGVTNIVGVLGSTHDTMLPERSVDLILLVDAYHEFDHPWEMARSMRRALRPGGRLALVEYRAEDPDVPIKPLHKMSQAQARRELEAAGLIWERTDDRLPIQHLMWFVRPPDS